MSLHLRELVAKSTKKNLNRLQILALEPEKKYDDGRTKQSFKDQTDIEKIMGRFAHTGTISHIAKYEGVYADFSDLDFHHQITQLAKGETIFAALPAELRKEFGQDPQAFFDFVNDPVNADDLLQKLPALAEPGQQLPRTPTPDANLAAADAAAMVPEAPKPVETPVATPAAPGGGSKAGEV